MGATLNKVAKAIGTGAAKVANSKVGKVAKVVKAKAGLAKAAYNVGRSGVSANAMPSAGRLTKTAVKAGNAVRKVANTKGVRTMKAAGAAAKAVAGTKAGKVALGVAGGVAAGAAAAKYISNKRKKNN